MPAASADNPSIFDRWRRDTLVPFEQRAFALFWWASLASAFGSMIQTVGASWLMATIAPSADMVALVQTAAALPFFFLSLIAGALADTRDRRRLMLVSQWLTLAASAVLAAVAFMGAVTPWLLLALTFLIGCGAALLAPAWQASIGDLVPREQIPPAVMANAVGFNLARSVGPALGGVIVAVLGAAAAFVINAVSYLGIIATLLWWRPARIRSELPPEPLLAAIAAGVRYVSLSPHLLSILLRCALYTIPIAAAPALMPIVARDLLGGVIVAVLGAAAAFVINAVSYLGLIATLLWWRPARVRSELPPEPLFSAIAAGVRYVSLSPHLLAILLRCALYTIPIAAAPALMPIVARDLLGGGAPTFGILLGAFGIGAMLGALGSAWLRNRFSSDALLRVLAALACIALVAIGQSRSTALTVLFHVLAGSTWTLGFTSFNIAVQLSSPRWVTGRMLATYQTVAFAGVALGSWWWGELAHAQGLREALTVAGLSALVSLAVARWLPVSVARLGSLDPRGVAALTSPSAAIHPASGPIVVTIEYRVPAESAAGFVAVANDLGRLRRRDGARAWSVCQDIDQPDLWVERFEHPTWLDYLRWRTRPTQSDQVVRARLAKLVVGEQGHVRRLVARPAGAEPLSTAPGSVEEAAAGRPIQRTVERDLHSDLTA